MIPASESRTRFVTSLLIFPVTLAAALAATAVAMARGATPAAALGLVSIGAWVLIAIAERWIPFRGDWNHSQGDVITDILHNFLSSYATIEAAKIGLIAGLLPLTARAGGLWPTSWPMWAQLVTVAVLIEFGCYWIHRGMHETPWLWPLHATHHSPGRLYWLNAGRDHPLGAAVTTAASLPPAIVLGVPPECMALYYVLQSVHGLFQHANLNVRLGPLNWIFSMAELHRWHHSKKLTESNNNYGLTLILWDIVFRTRYFPSREGPPTIGIGNMPHFPKGYLQQLTVPFAWRHWRRAAAPGAITEPASGSEATAR